MGYPSENVESIYRNALDDVRRLLEEKHKVILPKNMIKSNRKIHKSVDNQMFLTALKHTQGRLVWLQIFRNNLHLCQMGITNQNFVNPFLMNFCCVNKLFIEKRRLDLYLFYSKIHSISSF